MSHRPLIQIGPFDVSLQASSAYASHPEVDDLELHEYSHVDFSIWSEGPEGVVPILPSTIGLNPAYDHYFDGTSKAAYLAKPIADKIISDLEAFTGESARTLNGYVTLDEPEAPPTVTPVETVAIEPPPIINPVEVPSDLEADEDNE